MEFLACYYGLDFYSVQGAFSLDKACSQTDRCIVGISKSISREGEGEGGREKDRGGGEGRETNRLIHRHTKRLIYKLLS